MGFSPDTLAGTGGGQIVSGGPDGTLRVWLADLEALLALADSLIQRDPPIFTGDERIRFGFEGPNRAKAH